MILAYCSFYNNEVQETSLQTDITHAAIYSVSEVYKNRTVIKILWTYFKVLT